MQTILITGASGVLAQKLIKIFSKNNLFNTVASSRNINSLNKIDGVKYVNNIDIIATNILEDVDLIINCAFPRKQEPEILAEAIQFFESLILRAVEMNVKSFINISSQSVYNSYREMPASEFDPIKPFDNYGLAKFAQELIGLAITKNTDTKLTNIRLASLIGPEYEERVINKIIKNAQISHKISINNDKNVFGYFDVDDAAEGIFNFARNSNPKDWLGTYNLGATIDEQKDFRYIANCIKNLFQKHSVEVELNITTAEKADKLCYLDSRAFYKISNWEPKTTLEKSIEKIFNKGN